MLNPLTHPVLIAAAAAVIAATASSSLAQMSNITGSSKFSWGENIGWMNWKDAGDPAGSQGVVVGASYLAGFAWSENTGWINFGDGSPANLVSYANTTGADFGVNLNTDTGALAGLAWGENIGWINFSLPSLPAIQQPRLDKNSNRLRGYAWGENVGWINLDSDEEGKYVGVKTCRADFNNDGVLNPDDLADYINAYFSQPPDPAAEFNEDGVINPDDLADYINAYFEGCA